MSNFESDSVSSLHKRWLFTNLNPSSKKFSFLIASLSLFTNILLINFVITNQSIFSLAINTPIIIGIFTTTLIFDYLTLRGTPLNRFSKILHVSAFANLLWTLTVIGGFISEFIINTHSPPINLVLHGMFIAIGLRIGIFISVFGASLKRSIPVSFIQPLILFILLSFFYFNHIFYTNFLVYLFGGIILMIGITWTIVVDRIGRPTTKSAFKILQAFLIAWTENKSDEMEKIAESKANYKNVNTTIVNFVPDNSNNISLILPDLHPGPFNPIGGSNLPFDLFKFYSNSAMVMHSISDHSLNIPSKKQVSKYLDSLKNLRIVESGNLCTIPLKIKNGDCICTGFAMGDSIIIFFSKSPSGMEDIPPEVKEILEKFAYSVGYSQILIIDTHNSMGEKIDNSNIDILITLGKETIQKLRNQKQYPFKIGYSNTYKMGDKIKSDLSKLPDLGPAQLGVLLLVINNEEYVVCWCDSNNMKNGLRESIIKNLESKGVNIIEVCTSDTHSTSGKRNTKGYYTLGDITPFEKIINTFKVLQQEARKTVTNSTYQVYNTQSQVMVMGNDQFDDYSNALEKSFKITKIFLGVTFIVYILMLLFT